jgi:hypothetical protein
MKLNVSAEEIASSLTIQEAATVLRELVKKGKLRMIAADLGEGGNSNFPIHNVEVNRGVIILSSDDFLC